jgi:hypothetical protein
MFHVPEKFRVLNGVGSYNSTADDGNNGVFHISMKFSHLSANLRIIASDGNLWDHVSVSTPNRCPTWKEMNYVKDLFWDPEDCVVQFHPPKSNYVNNHPYTLHLWRPQTFEIMLPDLSMV